MPTGNLRTGRLPAEPARPRLELRSALGVTLPPVPVSVEYSAIPNVGMLGNDGAGDCVEAAVGHTVEQDTVYATGTEQVVTTEQALGLYTALTGFDPSDPNTDQGTVVQDALDYWRKTGVFGGHKLAAFAAVKVSDFSEVELAVNLFGQVIIGFNFPDSAMDQFNAGQPWTVVKGSPLDGGHCVTLIGYDADWLYVITWGQIQKMDRAFWTKYVDEAWVGITTDTINAQGASAFGGVIDLPTLGADFAALTGDPNPFPDPQPGPTPTPVPVPVPSPPPTPTPGPVPVIDSVDQALHDNRDVRALLRSHHTLGDERKVRAALRLWEHDKGFEV
jgi:hypothetical protein